MSTLTSDIPTSDTPRKRIKRVRKPRVLDTPPTVTSKLPSLFSIKPYLALLLLRFALVFITLASLEGSEYHDGVDPLAVTLLPHVAKPYVRAETDFIPNGMGVFNATRSIAPAAFTTGIPYVGISVLHRVIPGLVTPRNVAYLAIIAPRIWMFLLSILADVLLYACFAVYQPENATSGILTYASLWSTILVTSRNLNFALETLCVIMLIAGCFAWPVNTPLPVFVLSAIALAIGTFSRPPFAFFVFTPIIYLMSLWGKQGVDALRYIQSFIMGCAVFFLFATTFVTIDSLYNQTFHLLFTPTASTTPIHISTFDMFLDHVLTGGKFSYKGSLVYAPLNAFWTVANKEFLSTLAMNTSPGQMFLSLPMMLGPLFIVLMQDSYDGLKVAMKELMTELKQAANSGKPKKRKAKKPGMTKEQEDELYVYHDTIQTTFLLGLLIEVVQNHERLGLLSLLSLMPPCVLCIAGSVFGPESRKNAKYFHMAFTAGMVLVFGFMNQSGISRVMLQAGAGGVEAIPQNSNLIFYKGIIGHRTTLGGNLKNLTLHSGGDSRYSLMTTLRELKQVYADDSIFVCAPGTVDMKEEEFVRLQTLAYGHVSTHEMPNNIDDAFKKSTLVMYKFVGDEDEAIIRDDEEAAEKEEREREEKEREKQSKEEL